MIRDNILLCPPNSGWHIYTSLEHVGDISSAGTIPRIIQKANWSILPINSAGKRLAWTLINFTNSHVFIEIFVIDMLMCIVVNCVYIIYNYTIPWLVYSLMYSTVGGIESSLPIISLLIRNSLAHMCSKGLHFDWVEYVCRCSLIYRTIEYDLWYFTPAGLIAIEFNSQSAFSYVFYGIVNCL